MGNWYNLVAILASGNRYLSTNANGVMATTALDEGNEYERWVIETDGSIKSLKTTTAGRYLTCAGTLAAPESKGKWVIKDWKFGQETSAGSGILGALFFFGSSDAFLA